MKKIQMVCMLVAAVLLLTACGEKKKSKDIIAPKIVKVTPKEPIRMQENTDEVNVDWLGKTYHIAIHREPADSSSMVADENGQKYVDNVFTLAVSRPDGSVFYSHKFVKSALSSYLDEGYRKGGILEALMFECVDGDFLQFAASVGLPQTDEYIPLVVRLSRMGDLQIKRDSQMDTNSDMPQPDPSSEEI